MSPSTSPHHEHLKRIIGHWSFTSSVWPPGATEPLSITGSLRADAIQGGLFVQSLWAGSVAGQSFTALAIDGYDPAEGRYTTVSIDNLSPATLIYTGQCDGTGTVRTMHGQVRDPETGAVADDRAVTTFHEDGTVTTVNWRTPAGGAEYKAMETRLTPQ
ncbi:MAG: DUF1579 family protein [Acidobacteriota bacterium]|nr:DUF1579 family protein [Acidobacteriota bacterium]